MLPVEQLEDPDLFKLEKASGHLQCLQYTDFLKTH